MGKPGYEICEILLALRHGSGSWFVIMRLVLGFRVCEFGNIKVRPPTFF